MRQQCRSIFFPFFILATEYFENEITLTLIRVLTFKKVAQWETWQYTQSSVWNTVQIHTGRKLGSLENESVQKQEGHQWIEVRCEIVKIPKHVPPRNAEPFTLVENKYMFRFNMKFKTCICEK